MAYLAIMPDFGVVDIFTYYFAIKVEDKNISYFNFTCVPLLVSALNIWNQYSLRMASS